MNPAATAESAALRWQSSALTLFGGISLAAMPTALLVVSSHLFSITEQAAVVVAISFATFAAQLLSALTVESDLAGNYRPEALRVPRWLMLLALIGAAVLAVFPSSAVALSIAAPPLFAALEVGRVAQVASRRDRRELQASAVFTASLVLGVLLAIFGLSWGLTVIALGAAWVIIWRAIPTWSIAAHRTPHRTRAWLGVDALAAGVTFPLVTSLTLALAGAQATAVLGMVASVSAVAALPGSYLKMRLLGQHSAGEIWLAFGAAIAGTVALLLVQALGVFNLIFGSSWGAGVTIAILAVACLWRVISLVSVIPFAALRRDGRVRRLVPVRFAAAALTVLLVLLAAPSGVLLVFAALALAEVATAFGYWLADRR